MKTVSEYLYNLYKPHLPQLSGVKDTEVSIELGEIPVTFIDGTVNVTQHTPRVVVAATFVSRACWRGVCIPELGCIRLQNYSIYVSSPEEYFKILEVEFCLGRGEETQALLDILKENLK